MDKNIRLHKTIKEKDDLSRVVSSTFTTFVRPQQPSTTDSVQELFRLYESLYLEIPIDGPRSHTFLIEESSKLVELNPNNEAIQPLLDEITELRERLLNANEQIYELQSQLTGGNI